MQQSSRNITRFGATVILVFSPRHGNGPVHISWRYKHAEKIEFLNHDFTQSIFGGHSLVVGPLGIHSVSTYILPVLIGKLFPTHGSTFPLRSWVLWCSTWRNLASGSTLLWSVATFAMQPLLVSWRCCDLVETQVRETLSQVRTYNSKVLAALQREPALPPKSQDWCRWFSGSVRGAIFSSL